MFIYIYIYIHIGKKIYIHKGKGPLKTPCITLLTILEINIARGMLNTQRTKFTNPVFIFYKQIIHTKLYMYKHTCMHAYIHIYTQTYILRHIHIHTYIDRHSHIPIHKSFIKKRVLKI